MIKALYKGEIVNIVNFVIVNYGNAMFARNELLAVFINNKGEIHDDVVEQFKICEGEFKND